MTVSGVRLRKDTLNMLSSRIQMLGPRQSFRVWSTRGCYSLLDTKEKAMEYGVVRSGCESFKSLETIVSVLNCVFEKSWIDQGKL